MSRCGALPLGVLVLAGQLGCLIWPFPTGDLLVGRGRITKAYVARLQVGTSTREDVLALLGEPEEVLDGGAVLVYRWTEVRGFFAVAGSGGPALVLPFPGHRAVRLGFTPEGRLRHLVFEKGAPDSEQAAAADGVETNPGG